MMMTTLVVIIHPMEWLTTLALLEWVLAEEYVIV